jgi:integrase/recombinase XerD
MTKILGRNPARRCKAESEWPAGDRARRAQALIGGDVIDGGGSLADYSSPFLRRLDAGYGRWLQWLDLHNQLDPVASPAARVTRRRVTAYVDDLRVANSTTTASGRLDELYYMCRAIDVGHPLPWLPHMAAMIRASNISVRIKAPRMVGAVQLFRLGLRLMEHAGDANTPRRGVMQYRNGLIISLLAACPLRLRNLAMLWIGDSFIRHQDEWWIDIPGSATKTGVPLVFPLPTELTVFINEYLERYRPVLLEMRQRWVKAAGDALWISTAGSAMSYDSFYGPITRTTRAAFGRSINPHLFRDCAATSVAVDDPDHVRIVAPLLGHASLSTSERHYNQARSHQAARRWQEHLLALRGRA